MSLTYKPLEETSEAGLCWRRLGFQSRKSDRKDSVRKFGLLEILLLLNFAFPVRCRHQVNLKQGNTKWSNRNNFESSYFGQLSRIVFYPKCLEDSHCAGEQICHFQTFETYLQTDKPLIGECRCPLGSVLWKWRCYLSVPKLGSHCVVSRQCQIESDSRRHCNPLTRKCDCESGFSQVWQRCVSDDDDLFLDLDTSDFNKKVFIMTTTASSTFHTSGIHLNKSSDEVDGKIDQQTIVGHIIAHFNQTIVQNSNNLGASGSNHTLGSHHLFNWSQENINTISYIALVIICVVFVGVLSAIYARVIKERRRSQAAIRNLLDLISENRSTQSVFTTEGIPGFTNSYPSNNNNSSNATKDFVDPDCSSSSGSGYSMNYCDSSNCDEPTTVLEDRTHLPPIEDSKFPKLPSPHKTIPVLPSIRPEGNQSMTNFLSSSKGIGRPRSVPTNRMSLNFDEKNSTLSSSGPISAFSHFVFESDQQMSDSKKSLQSAASFPDDDPTESLETKMDSHNNMKVETKLSIRSHESDTKATFM